MSSLSKTSTSKLYTLECDRQGLITIQSHYAQCAATVIRPVVQQQREIGGGGGTQVIKELMRIEHVHWLQTGFISRSTAAIRKESHVARSAGFRSIQIFVSKSTYKTMVLANIWKQGVQIEVS